MMISNGNERWTINNTINRQERVTINITINGQQRITINIIINGKERVTVNTTKNGQERVIEEHYNKWTVDSAFLLQLILLDGLQQSVNSSSNNYTKFFSKTVVYGSQCVDQQCKRLRIAVVLFLTWPTCRSLGQHVCKSSSFYTFAAIYICLSSIDLCIQLLLFF